MTFKTIPCVAACALAANLAFPAFAQDVEATSAAAQAEPVPAEAAPEPMSEDIIVTAQRRSSTVREVPFSIAAFGGEQLRTAQINSPSALTQEVPGITINTADKSLSILAIRGNVSTFRTATLDSPVAYFVDDIYYLYNNDVNSNFYDVDRIEVLRGPQGTLFGRNVVGGAISVFTNDPVYDDEYSLQLTGGNGGYFRSEGVVNTTLVDQKVAARLAFSTENSEGLISTPNQDGKYGEMESWAARGKLLFEPTDTLRIVLSGDYSYTKGNGGAIGLGIGGDQTIPDSFGDFTEGEWVNNDYARSPYALRLRGGSLRADLDVLGGTLTAITGYRMNDSRSTNDDIPTGTVVPVFDRRQKVRNRSFTQEVRFASGPGRLSYVVGAFFLKGDVQTTNYFYYSPLAGSAVAGALPTNPDISNITRDQQGTVRSLAVFGEATFEVTDTISLVAGGRYTSDRKTVDYHAFSTTDPDGIPGLGFPGEVTASGGDTWNAFTPRVTLKWKPDYGLNFYATWARGFKSGGYVDNAYRDPTLPLQPEHADNYEIGAKTRLLDNLLDVNLSLFKQTTRDLQNFSGAGGIAHTYNGTLKMKGWELETVLRPIDGLRLNGNYTHLVGRYSDLVDPLVGSDYSGNPAKFAPRDSFMLAATYDVHLASGAMLSPHVDFNYSSRISTDDANTLRLYPNLHDATRGRTLNARLNYTNPDGRWKIGIWGKNLTNNYQIVNADDITAFVAVPGQGAAYWKIFTNTPRSYGLTVSFTN